jgi:hypothetical protein
MGWSLLMQKGFRTSLGQRFNQLRMIFSAMEWIRKASQPVPRTASLPALQRFCWNNGDQFHSDGHAIRHELHLARLTNRVTLDLTTSVVTLTRNFVASGVMRAGRVSPMIE